MGKKHYIDILYFSGDEILAVNGKSLQGMSHDEAINEFRAIRHGPVILRVARRDPAFILDQESIVVVKEWVLLFLFTSLISQTCSFYF